ncbi:hypothetical protein QBC32DRAFT_366218 [Pseudoneurospora amorphoporcata]|uniref:Uncharacterized protein n=1 Tax=Pseudoneurospora amorphoporcata TaxID=241081 RepID=A0AAN6SA82_9PEZI|nr:hypothetical protein QBC32DRAFT_366218 [Pseudoneurospora amorphoporcata]
MVQATIRQPLILTTISAFGGVVDRDPARGLPVRPLSFKTNVNGTWEDEIKNQRPSRLEAWLLTVVGTEGECGCIPARGPFGVCSMVDGVVKNACNNCHFNSGGIVCFHVKHANDNAGTPATGRRRKHAELDTGGFTDSPSSKKGRTGTVHPNFMASSPMQVFQTHFPYIPWEGRFRVPFAPES